MFSFSTNDHFVVDGVCTQGLGEFSKCKRKGFSSDFCSAPYCQWSQQQRQRTKHRQLQLLLQCLCASDSCGFSNSYNITVR